ncbi:YhdP family protein [Vibrio sp. LaRot3]|uniref:YhdP family protein n=1 Tax=Vibrio sp. LaRot3 TaxID=2998829 RepID=UPI0022CDF31D|nr:YhdP family protein [Vibrio sp. LaRot3]MDA0148582.1 YhdP family protein [Vibrio sp. LaRot3]
MKVVISHFTQVIKWGLVSALVLLAIAITALRVALPNLNHYQAELLTWLSKETQFELQVESISGFWRNTHPSISLANVVVQTPKASGIEFTAQTVEVEFDLFQSLSQLQPVIADLNIHNLNLDVRSIKWVKEDGVEQLAPQGEQQNVVQQIDQLLLRQLDRFSLYDSTVHLTAVNGDERTLDIARLKWQNQGRRHLVDGEITIAGTQLNSLDVQANFVDHGSLKEVSGEFYLAADNVLVTPWLTKYLQSETGIEKGQVSLNSWLTLSRSKPINAYVEVLPSELTWQEGQKHELVFESGVFVLEPSDQGWQVNAHSLKLLTDNNPWPEFDMAFNWQPEQWLLNVSQLDLEAISPLIKLAPESKSLTDVLQKLQLGGQLEDIRISMADSVESLKYSATLTQASMQQWELLPELHHLQATVVGNTQQAKAQVSLIDDVLPYGDVFQAPLNIKQSQVDIVWQNLGEQGWRLWADKVTAATPDLQVLGAFRLDFPVDKSPFLSFYAEADLYNAGETWRYLPTLALGLELTDYLSSAIQGGKVNTAKLLWYGELADFPYRKHDGMFQAWVGLKKAKFSFDTAWPPITDLQLDLLFQNDAMYLDSRSAKLMDVDAKRITGRIPELAENGHIEIEATAVAQGNAVRDYMTASPLVDSVGAALTTIQVQGEVKSEFKLHIPFDDFDTRAWGYADLAQNQVNIETPPMELAKVSGRIEFDNDVVKGAGLAADLLSQPISIDFNGENAGKGYSVGIDVLGEWAVEPLAPYVGQKWLDPISGHVPWQTNVDIQLNDIGFTYQVDASADLQMLASDYPYPLGKKAAMRSKASMQASGNQESITARLQLPDFKYQAEIDIGSDMPVIKATNLILGKGSYKISPIVGHQLRIRAKQFDLDAWLEALTPSNDVQTSALAKMNTPTMPKPQRVDINVDELKLASIDWNDVAFTAKRKNLGWHMNVSSQEVEGEASYIEPYDLSVKLERLHVFLPMLDDEAHKNKRLFEADEQDAPLISEFDRAFHKKVPNVTLAIDDLWVQGYKLGHVLLDLQRQGKRVEWKQLSVKSGSSELEMQGSWLLDGERSKTKMQLNVSGENNSEVMERFGISSGVQEAPFKISSNLEWNGAPWSMKVNSLSGQVDSRLGKGVISDVSGAAKFLGMFSLDSIIRKMQLDFSDVFDKGMAFNSITGSGEIKNGIFVTNNIQMDAVAGEMSIKGLANLNSRTVDAEVNFVPDITSGIPVLTAFAVTPQTALYVLAITTVISPVVEVFSQVDYEVKGPFDSPVVKELSRSKGEFKLPKNLRDAIK